MVWESFEPRPRVNTYLEVSESYTNQFGLKKTGILVSLNRKKVFNQ